jgi:hypothetical protein
MKRTNLCDWVQFQEKTKRKRVVSCTCGSKMGFQTLFQFLPNSGNRAWIHLSFKYPQSEFMLPIQQSACSANIAYILDMHEMYLIMRLQNLMYLKIVNFDQEKCTTREQKLILVICTTLTWHCYLEEVRSVFFSNNFSSFFL